MGLGLELSSSCSMCSVSTACDLARVRVAVRGRVS